MIGFSSKSRSKSRSSSTATGIFTPYIGTANSMSQTTPSNSSTWFSLTSSKNQQQPTRTAR